MSEKKLKAFDGLRGLAALAVVFHHLVLAFLPGFYAAPLHPFFRVSIEGLYHVRVFFVLSGFVLSISYLRAHRLQILQSLAVRRYFRFLSPVAGSIFFAYGLMTVGLYFNDRCGFLLGQPANSWLRIYNRFQPNFFDACRQILWTTYFGPTDLASYNNVLWTMALELKGSFLVLSFLALCGERRHRWLAYVVLSLVLYLTLGERGGIYCCFLAGTALCDLYVSGYAAGGLTAILLIIAGLFLGGLSPGWLAKRGWSMSARGCHDCFSLGACLLLAGVAVSSTIQKCLSARLFVFLGKVSFPLYLVHLPLLFSAGAGVFCLLHASLGRVGASAAAAVATLTASLTLAWLASLTFEPFAIWSGRVVERWLSSPSSRQAVPLSVAVDSEARGDSALPAEIRIAESQTAGP